MHPRDPIAAKTFRWLVFTVLIATVPTMPVLAQSASVYGSGLFQLGDGAPPAGFAGAASLMAKSGVRAPDWSDLFGADGWALDARPFDESRRGGGDGIPDYMELYHGLWVAFTADNEDAPIGFEPSARGRNAREVVNGYASPSRDLEDLLGYLTRDANGNLVAYVAASRLDPGDARIDLELNQSFVRVGPGGFGMGLPWKVVGERTAGDLLVSLRFQGEILERAVIKVWSTGENGNAGWRVVQRLSAEGCNDGETFCVLINAAAVSGGPWSGGRSHAPGTFLELGVNVGDLLGSQPAFLTLQARTSEDLAFAYFSARGR